MPTSTRQRLFLHRLDLQARHVHLPAPPVATGIPQWQQAGCTRTIGSFLQPSGDDA